MQYTDNRDDAQALADDVAVAAAAEGVAADDEREGFASWVVGILTVVVILLAVMLLFSFAMG